MRRKKPLERRRRQSVWLWLVLASGIALAIGTWIWKSRTPISRPGKPAALNSNYKTEVVTFSKYAGSKSCRECHAKTYDVWTNSHHALAERTLDLSMDRLAFDPSRSFTIGSQTWELQKNNGRFEIIASGADSRRQNFAPQYVIGVDPLRQFMIPSPRGRYQVAEIAFDPRRGDWFDVFGNENRRPGEWGHWTGSGMTWNAMCAACHNTHLQKNYREPTDSYATAMAERGVGCEACHGPMVDHVAWQKSLPRRKGDPTIRKFDRNQMLSICGSCHSRRAELTGDFVPGDNFPDRFSLTIPDDTEVFFPDGQIHDEDYEYTSFLSSKMFLAGVRCLDCHDPHSAKTLVRDNTLCLRCHGPPLPPAPKIDPGAHSHHREDEPGGRCVDCHMPQTVYMQRHARRDHGFTIPDPLLTKQHNIPNACNRCHTDRGADWALESVEKWYGLKMERPSRTRAQLVAQARSGQSSAVEGLLKMAREEKIPLWRAVATGLLQRWCEDSNITLRLLEKAADPDPMVRAIAARSLEPLASAQLPTVHAALNRLLQDNARAVRVEAAWALRSEIDPRSGAGLDLMEFLRQNADQPSGALQLGFFYLDRAQTEAALPYFRRAASWDTNSPPFHHALAMGLSAQGKLDETVRELETACRLAPREAEYRYKLALALNEFGKLDEATTALEAAVKLDPQFSRAWYNLGLAYSQANQPERGLEALVRAESIDRQAGRIPYARATILARLGRLQEARTAARRALELDPAFSDAAALVQKLSGDQK